MGIFNFARKKKPTTTEKANPLYQDYFINTYGNSSVVWSNVYKNKQNNKKLIESYNDLAEVAAPINFYADGSSLVKFDVFKKGANKLTLQDNHWINDLLANPNQLQTHEEFISQIIIYRLLLGNSFMSGMVGDTVAKGRKPNMLYNLPPQNVLIELESNNKDYRLNQIKRYIFETSASKVTAEANSTLHLKATNPNFENLQYLYGLSNLVSVNKNIQSIEEGYSAKVSLYKHGPRVILTGKSNTVPSVESLPTEELSNLKDRVNNSYGLTEEQYQYMITDIPLDVRVISKDVKQLQLNENNTADFERICGVLNIPSIIISDNSNSTYSNVKEAKTEFYNGAFITLMDSIAKGFTEYFNRFEKGIVIKCNYDNVAEIVAERDKKNDKILEDCKAGLITRNQYLESCGYETVVGQGFDEYYYYYNGWNPIKQDNENTDS